VNFVTHHVQTALPAGRVCLVEAGRVVGAGAHNDLLLDCDPCRRLYVGGTGGDDGRILRAVPRIAQTQTAPPPALQPA